MTAKEVMRRLRREGVERRRSPDFEERTGKGAHRVFRRGDRTVIVSAHSGDIPVGTLRDICRQAGWEWPPQRRT